MSEGEINCLGSTECAIKVPQKALLLKIEMSVQHCKPKKAPTLETCIPFLTEFCLSGVRTAVPTGTCLNHINQAINNLKLSGRFEIWEVTKHINHTIIS